MSTIIELPARQIKPAVVRVAAYARVSTASDRQLHSYAAQVSHYQQMISSRAGWVFAGIYTDHGITGTSTAAREGFQRMMAAARAGDIDLILTKSISRFARNTVDLLEYVRELKILGVAVLFERENIDTSTMDGEILLTLLASFAQAESESNSQAVKWAVRKKYEEGYAHSITALGYQTVGREIRIVPDEAELVRRLFHGYLAGISPEKIAQQFRDEGLTPTSRGLVVNPNRARTVLDNPIYIGTIIGQKYIMPTVGGTACLNQGEEPMYVIEEHHEPIIDRATFDAVQAELKRRKRAGHLTLAPSVGSSALTHRVICTVCGRRYHRKTKHRTNWSYKFWWCETATRGNGNPCKAKQIKEPQLHQTVLETLGLELWDDEKILSLIDHIEISPSLKIRVVLTTGDTMTRTLAGGK
ncbi:recombinase family protein [Corynebacterium kozikiae]|uniref:recombinase family protein n=1 Tax=Corynebacterium kozikiae TaxID=2968469 RepID=UPI00211B8AC2|nr:recombinase family protein [Corynebacterium sp. 76QC2CO]MCQ9343800.1 recombinase family protein [Corynebacterium sp. 76QC2CO]